MDIISYGSLQDALLELSVPCDASEWHGVTSAMLCIDYGTSVEACLRRLMGDQIAALQNTEAHNLDVLQSAFVETKARLVDPEMSYSLLLPLDDAVSLHERVQALVLWCRGYLFGLAAGLPALKQPQQIQDIVRDIDMISMADAENAIGEGDERSYYELVEYLKVLVISVADELQPPANSSELLQ